MFFSNKYVHSMLAKENGEWKKNSNSDLIIRVRDLLEQFPRIVMVSQSDSELSKKVKSLSENVVSKGKCLTLDRLVPVGEEQVILLAQLIVEIGDFAHLWVSPGPETMGR